MIDAVHVLIQYSLTKPFCTDWPLPEPQKLRHGEIEMTILLFFFLFNITDIQFGSTELAKT